MKKLVCKICLCLVSAFCLLINTGCSCARELNVKGSVTVMDFASLSKEVKISYTLEQKYREPIDTPCYSKVVSKNDDNTEKVEYKLIPSSQAENVSACFDAMGNEFEKATPTRGDKRLIADGYIARWGELSQKESTNTLEKVAENAEKDDTFDFNSRELPTNKNYSYIYTIKITNGNNKHGDQQGYIYLKKITLDDIVDLSGLKEDKKSNVNFTINGEIVNRNGVDYYVIEDLHNLNTPGELTMVLEIKSLTSVDTISSRTKDIEFNIVLEFAK